MIRSIAIVMFAAGPCLAADEKPAKGKATGPEGYVYYAKALEGGYFVPDALFKEYEQLESKLKQIERRLDDGSITGKEAIEQTESVRKSLRETSAKLENAKKLVAALKVHRSEETVSFDLGAESLLVITAKQAKIVGTNEAKVRVVVEKVILSADDKPVDAEMAAIKIVQHRGADPEIVGKSPLKAAADEQELLNKSKDKLDQGQRDFRREIAESNRRFFAPYDAFQGKEFDQVSLTGLEGSEGNQQISLEMLNADKSGHYYSVWRRHATMTVYVPQCKALAVRGCRCGLDIGNVKANLVVTPDGGSDRDYQAHFTIRGVRGNVRVVDFPLNRLEDVSGDVRIDAIEDFANSGTMHANNERFFHFYQADRCDIRNVAGKMEARFGRVDLNLESIRGGIDLSNDFGETTWTIKEALPKALHRLRSVAGRLQVVADPAALGDMPVTVAGNFGSIRTNAPQDQYRDFSVGAARGGGAARNWHGFRKSREKTNKEQLLDTFDLPDLLSGKTPPGNGVFIVNEAGPIVYRLSSAK